MRHETQVHLIERVLSMLDAGETDMVESESRIPTSVYTDTERFGQERRVLFRQHPLMVGHRSQVAEPGDYFTHDCDGVPLLVVRGTDGVVRAFLNVCRHRGTRLVNPGSGCKRRLVCPYHAWSYTPEGALDSLPDAVGFPNLDRSSRGLVELPLVEASGFIWVCPTPESTPDFDAILAPLAADFDAMRMADHVVYEPKTLVRKLNWKLVFDVFLEAYHLKYAHKRSIYPLFFDNVGLFEQLGPHQRNLFPKRTITALRDTDPAEWSLRHHSNILYAIFPNILMLIQPDHVSVLAVYPKAIDETRLETYTLVRETPDTDKARAYWDKNRQILYSAIEEDFALGSSIQEGLSSGANSELLLGRYEQSLAWFHGNIETTLGGIATGG